MTLVTNQKVNFPESYNTLRHFVKNFAFLILVIAETEAILTGSLMQVLKHVCKYESDYIWHFVEFPNFGAFFINKIYVGVQKFIHSCAFKNTNKLDIQAIEFSNFLSSIDSREINFIRLPKFLKDMTTKAHKSKRKREENNDDSQPRNKKKVAKDRIINKDERDPQAKLPANLQFGEVFCRECCSGLDQPKMDNGKEMCNRFYGKGYCFPNCKRGHDKKNSGEQVRWKKFFKAILGKYKERNPGVEIRNNNQENGEDDG